MLVDDSTLALTEQYLQLGGLCLPISRPHAFGLVIEGPPQDGPADYLHESLLSPGLRERFLRLVEDEGLVVCKKLRSDAPSYRRVRGKSSFGRLSQAEYFHHDGCSTQIKPRVVEIRLPEQEVGRDIVTSVARFPEAVRAMVLALPKHLRFDEDIAGCWQAFSGSQDQHPPLEQWDLIQGRVNRLVRRHFDSESARAYFREVDAIADAYRRPWEMGESRLILNAAADLRLTMQHRRAYQLARQDCQPSGCLVKRWTAEEA